MSPSPVLPLGFIVALGTESLALRDAPGHRFGILLGGGTGAVGSISCIASAGSHPPPMAQSLIRYAVEKETL